MKLDAHVGGNYIDTYSDIDEQRKENYAKIVVLLEENQTFKIGTFCDVEHGN